MTTPYPRDLRGYGRNPPHAGWPGQARIAVQFVLNYEEGGESNPLHGDATSETVLSELGTAPAFDNRHMTALCYSVSNLTSHPMDGQAC